MHLYDVFAVEIVPEGKEPKQHLAKTYMLTPVAEFQNDANATVRLVRIGSALDEVIIKGRKAVAE